MFSIAIHGGAGTILQSVMTPDMQAAYEAGLRNALHAGYAILKAGGSSLEAATTAVVVLEDCELFNAGKGSVFNHEGGHEMDASVMRGDTLAAGAVCGISNVKNPVLLAKEIMETSEHVMLCGKGAEQFARERKLRFEPDAYFFNQLRYDQLQEALKENKVRLDHTADNEKKFGTVGAVALDATGNLAAATSTGGMTNKQYGRVGDTPLIGAGTYANNRTCAVSCTGHGELFIRQVVAHQLHCLMLYKSLSLQEAADSVVMEDLVNIGGEGGLIAVDTKGNIALTFNSEGMYRAMKKSDGTEQVLIYK